MRSMRQRAGVAGLAWAVSQTALAEFRINLQTPASQVAQDVFQLHNLIMLVCLGIFIVVFGAMFYSLSNIANRPATRPRISTKTPRSK